MEEYLKLSKDFIEDIKKLDNSDPLKFYEKVEKLMVEYITKSADLPENNYKEKFAKCQFQAKMNEVYDFIENLYKPGFIPGDPAKNKELQGKDLDGKMVHIHVADLVEWLDRNSNDMGYIAKRSENKCKEDYERLCEDVVLNFMKDGQKIDHGLNNNYASASTQEVTTKSKSI